MTRLQRFLIALSVSFLLGMVPTAASAQPGAGDLDGFGIDGIETGLVGLFPLVILISSILLKPSAQEEVKEFFPLVVGLVVSVVYFVADSWPGFGTEVVINVGLLIAMATKLFDPVSALSKLIFAGRSLNAITGPGIVGSGSTLEGD